MQGLYNKVYNEAHLYFENNIVSGKIIIMCQCQNLMWMCSNKSAWIFEISTNMSKPYKICIKILFHDLNIK